MAEIVLNVGVRGRAGTGGAPAGPQRGLVPGILYGGAKAPVSIAVKSGEFRRALHTGKLLGHLVTLKYGDEVQPVIAKDVQFHPVTGRPIRPIPRRRPSAYIRISVPVRFRNHDASPGLKRGGALNVNLHELELDSDPALGEVDPVDVEALRVDRGEHDLLQRRRRQVGRDQEGRARTIARLLRSSGRLAERDDHRAEAYADLGHRARRTARRGAPGSPRRDRAQRPSAPGS